jgi:hypothetical protein
VLVLGRNRTLLGWFRLLFDVEEDGFPVDSNPRTHNIEALLRQVVVENRTVAAGS